MSKTASVNLRIDPKLKKNAEEIFQKIGLSRSEAISLFYTQVTLHDGLPFSIRIPNTTTQKAIEDAQNGKEIVHGSLDDLKGEWEKL